MRTILEAMTLASVWHVAQQLARATSEIIPTPETTEQAMIGCTALALCVLAWCIRAHCRKVGGLTFARLGRLSISFCVTHR